MPQEGVMLQIVEPIYECPYSDSLVSKPEQRWM